MEQKVETGGRMNCFDAVRLIAASAVIFDHAYALSASEFRLGLLSNSLGAIAVKIFFVVSGYLIFSSWERDGNLFRYLIRRSLRIFPALFVLCVLTVFIVGPTFTSLKIFDYFARREVWYYFYNVILYPVYALPGVFRENAYPIAVNGSLWTLPVEFAMYLILPIVSVLQQKTSSWFMMAWAFMICWISIWFTRIAPPAGALVIYGTLVTAALDIIPYFFIGILFRVMHWEKVLNPMVALISTALVAVLQPLDPVINEVLLYFLLPYVTLSVALSSQKWFSQVGKFGDFSYGVYIYAFPVQQMLYSITDNHLAPVVNAVSALFVTLFLALVSWKLVEAPALRLKPTWRKRGVLGVGSIA